jgi:hypothetical protein
MTLVEQLGAALAAVAAVLLGCDRASPAAQRPTTAALAAGDLCVTSGSLASSAGALSVDSPQFRAVAARSGDTEAELRFTYAGPTAEASHLGSGAARRQIGLKLRAKDPCNLVYAMWRIDPGPELVVQVKRNPGARTSAECQNHGYRTVRPSKSAPVGEVAAGSTHTLRASLQGPRLDVWADGQLVWQGTLGDDAAELDGPVGVRSDNARFTFTLAAGGSSAAAGSCRAPDPE